MNSVIEYDRDYSHKSRILYYQNNEKCYYISQFWMADPSVLTLLLILMWTNSSHFNKKNKGTLSYKSRWGVGRNAYVLSGLLIKSKNHPWRVKGTRWEGECLQSFSRKVEARSRAKVHLDHRCKYKVSPFLYFAVPWFKSGASSMLDNCFTTESHPLSEILFGVIKSKLNK